MDDGEEIEEEQRGTEVEYVSDPLMRRPRGYVETGCVDSADSSDYDDDESDDDDSEDDEEATRMKRSSKPSAKRAYVAPQTKPPKKGPCIETNTTE